MAALPLVFRVLICLAYIGVGIFVLVYRPFKSPVFDFPFSLACFGYGLFRGYRAFKDYRAETEEE